MQDIAQSLIKKSENLNFFGPANLNGSRFLASLLNKYKNLESGSSFSEVELGTLKAAIAQDLTQGELSEVNVYPLGCDQALTVPDRIKKRILHCLKMAKCFISSGSVNCDIAYVLIYLALVERITVPIELFLFSGEYAGNDDTTHSFITLGCPNPNAINVIHTENAITAEESVNYLICDAYHKEFYPVKIALKEQNNKLARYHDISINKPPVVRKFVYIDDPLKYYSDPDIKQACDEIFATTQNNIFKNQVNAIFRNCLLTSLKARSNVLSEMKTAEKALRTAANSNLPFYIKHIIQEFNIDVNAQDSNSLSRKTALHWAAERGNNECIEVLMALNANPDIPDASGKTANEILQMNKNKVVAKEDILGI